MKSQGTGRSGIIEIELLKKSTLINMINKKVSHSTTTLSPFPRGVKFTILGAYNMPRSLGYVPFPLVLSQIQM